MESIYLVDPIAFTIGPISIYWYGVLIATAVGLGLWIAMKEANRLGLNGDLFLDLLLWVVPAAIIGARLYYVLFHWETYCVNLIDIFAIRNGGIAIHGALIGSFLAGYFYIKKHYLSFLQIVDIAAPSIILGQAIGRWGNFLNQEAYGGPVSITFLENLHLPSWIIEQMHIMGVYYHPTFLYESIWNVLGFLFLLFLRYRNPYRGTIFMSYLIWYSIGRFFIEGLRTDSLTFYGPVWLENLLHTLWEPMQLLFQPGLVEGGNIRIAQLVSILVIFVAIIFLFIYRKKSHICYNEQVK